MTDDIKPPQPVANACAYCGAACVGQDHPAFPTLHWHDPAGRERRAERERRVLANNARLRPTR
jgi:hypothetical protein